MTLAHARALLGGMACITIPHDPAGDEAALGALARWCLRWSPRSRADPPTCVLLDISGCEHLHPGGERGLASGLAGAMRRFGLTARVAVAGTVGAAWGVAHAGPEGVTCVEPGGEREAIGALPPWALRIEPEVVGALEEIGVRTIGQVLDLPRIALPGRYGPEIVRRIDQALGDMPESVHGTAPADSPVAVLEMPGGTTRWESVAEGVKHLLAGLTVQLQGRECGVTRLEARFTRLGASPASICLGLSRPTRSRTHLWSLLRPHLERLHLGAGIEFIELRALEVMPITHEQETIPGLAPGSAREKPSFEVAQALEIVASRLGAERVRRFAHRASHRPERAWSTERALAPAGDGPGVPGAFPPRPSRMFDPPEPAEVMALCPEGPVLRLAWRDGSHGIIACLGPERIGGEWWVSREAQRDYFRVQNEQGLWLWVFRDLDSGDWCVHGVWG